MTAGWAGLTQLVGETRAAGDTAERRAAVERLVGYFAQHVGRLDDARCLAEGRPIGRRAVEGWAKMLELRLKRRGARWCERHVHAVAVWACVAGSDQGTAYWRLTA